MFDPVGDGQQVGTAIGVGLPGWGVGAVPGDRVGDSVVDGHGSAPWSDGLVGVGQGVGNRAVLLVERPDEWPEARLGGDEPRPGVVGDQGGDTGIPALSDEVQATIDGMEPAV